jgi:hypothetical protein
MGCSVRDQELDDQLAALTDRLLAGDESLAPDELDDLAQVVRQLQQMIAPDVLPSPAFRVRLTQRVTREWNARQRARRARQWRRPRLIRLSVLVALVTLALVAVALLATGGDNRDEGLQGTASGSAAWGVVVGAMIGIGLGFVILWLRQRRKP